MDNGRHNAIFSSPEMDGNLNEENWQKSLEISTPNDLPSPEELVKPVEPSPGVEPVSIETPNPTPNPTPELGQIVSVEPPVTRPESQVLEGAKIKTTGDRLDKASLEVIDRAVDELNQTGNLSTFYDEVRDMTEVNLNNSFNRKLYDQKEGN